MMSSFIDQFSSAMTATQNCLTAVCRFGEEPPMARQGKRQQQLELRTWLNPVGLATDLVRFFGHWMSTRSTEAFCLGLPALGAAALVACLAFAMAPSSETELRHAEHAFQTGLRTDDLVEAEFQLQRMCFLQPSDPELLFRRVELLIRTGRSGEARQLALELASAHRHGKSLYWLAAGLFAEIRQADSVPPETDRQFLSWINAALDALPTSSWESRQASFTLAKFYMLRNRPELAISPLKTAAPEFVEAQISLAVLQRQLGKREAAKSTASDAAARLQRKLAQSPEDAQTRHWYVKALLLAEQEQEAVAYLQDLAQLFPAVRSLLSEQADVHAAWCERILVGHHDNRESIARATRILYEGLRCDATNPRVIRLLTQLCCRRDFEDPQLETRLHDALAAGARPGLIHFIQGTRALNEGRIDDATTHLEIAMAHDDSFPGLLNNLAVSMSSGETTDLETARTLIDRAIRMMPNQPQFRDTRGRILLKLGETSQAIADLELALQCQELLPETHELLTRAYQEVNVHELVQRHEAYAKNLRTAMNDGGTELARSTTVRDADTVPAPVRTSSNMQTPKR